MNENAVISFKGETLMEILLIDYRWIIVCFFLLPLSFLYDLLFYVRNAIIFRLNSARRAHDQKVKTVQKQVIENLSWLWYWLLMKLLLFQQNQKNRSYNGIKLINQRKCAPLGRAIKQWASVNLFTNQACFKLIAIWLIFWKLIAKSKRFALSLWPQWARFQLH